VSQAERGELAPLARAGGGELPAVVVLCGGRGTRLQEHGREPVSVPELPKPLVQIGGQPILWHVVMLYAAQGFRRFVLATGHRGELIERFVAATAWPAGVLVRCLDTGAETNTGGRVRLAGKLLEGDERICATYADGLADVDLHALLAFHAAHGGLASVTVVRPQLQFGVVEISSAGRVLAFREKPRSEHWVNGGFFCFARQALERIGQDSVLEREPLQQLAREGQLHAYRHEGFWRCMDTYKDAVALRELWADGRAPWMLWASRDAGQPDAESEPEPELQAAQPRSGGPLVGELAASPPTGAP
jgi:glucose-1-phosphate cytidylyltransferase